MNTIQNESVYLLNMIPFEMVRSCINKIISTFIYVIKTNSVHYLFSVYLVSQHLHVSGIFVAYHQEVIDCFHFPNIPYTIFKQFDCLLWQCVSHFFYCKSWRPLKHKFSISRKKTVAERSVLLVSVEKVVFILFYYFFARNFWQGGSMCAAALSWWKQPVVCPSTLPFFFHTVSYRPHKMIG
jgi:hypothetical protein